MIIVLFKTVVIVGRESRMTSAKMPFSLATGRKYNTSKYNPEHHHTHTTSLKKLIFVHFLKQIRVSVLLVLPVLPRL